jgi:prepilin-type N-terminal cleavage/methylation domain-containing protein
MGTKAAQERLSGARSGFTLLELLVALAITGVVVLAVSAAVSVSTTVALRGRDESDSVLRVEAAYAAMRRWLAAAYLGGAGAGLRFEGADLNSRGTPADELSFVTLDPWMLEASPAGPVRVRLRVAGRDSGLVAEYAGFGPDARTEVRSVRRISVLPGVRGMDARYLVALGDEVRWFSGWSSRVRLPRAVELRFYAGSGDALPELLRLPLRVALPGHG